MQECYICNNFPKYIIIDSGKYLCSDCVGKEN